MIQAILSWAVAHWSELESRIALLTLGRPDGPVRPLDLDAKQLLVIAEGVLREVPERGQVLDELYAEAREAAREAARIARMTPEEIRAEKRAKRAAEIATTRAAFG